MTRTLRIAKDFGVVDAAADHAAAIAALSMKSLRMHPAHRKVTEETIRMLKKEQAASKGT